MKNSNILFIAILLCVGGSLFANTKGLQFPEIGASMATALGQIYVYPDSTFSSNDFAKHKEGTLFEVIGSSKLLHLDADQKQKFKWYRVKSVSDGSTGWAFGDGLAICITKKEDVQESLQAFHQKNIHLNNGFENATIWVASVEGRDNFHKQDYLNPLYNEQYLVITNAKNQSIHIRCASSSAIGQTKVDRLLLEDVTGDNIPEFLLERNSLALGSDVSEKSLEIFSIQAGTLTSVFEERLTLLYAENIASPALSKFVEIENQSIRLAFVEFGSCPKNPHTPDKCLEYVTSTWQWSREDKKFKPIYEETRSSVEASTNQALQLIHSDPTRKIFLAANETFTLVRQHEELMQEHGKQIAKYYFLVRKNNGEMGYLPASNIVWRDIEHADILRAFYASSPASKNAWKWQGDFLKLASPIKKNSLAKF